MKLYGWNAIMYKQEHMDAELNKSTDPTEEEKFDIHIADAIDIAMSDPSLIWVEIKE